DTITATGEVNTFPLNCTATHTWTLQPSLSCMLLPPTATKQAGTSHTVTLLVLNGVVPLPNATVAFEVTGGPNSGIASSATTNPSGSATFTYTSDGINGTDTIMASGEFNGN